MTTLSELLQKLTGDEILVLHNSLCVGGSPGGARAILDQHRQILLTIRDEMNRRSPGPVFCTKLVHIFTALATAEDYCQCGFTRHVPPGEVGAPGERPSIRQARLKEGLAMYGRHLSGCGILLSGSVEPCDCGLLRYLEGE